MKCKILMLLSSFVIYGGSCISQNKKFELGLGLVYGNPINAQFSSYFKSGKGIALSLNYKVTKLGSVTSSFCLIKCKSKIAATNNYKFNFIKVGYKTNIANSIMYLFADAGISQRSYGVGWKTSPLIATGFGTSIKLNKNNRLHVASSINASPSNPVNSLWLLVNVNYKIGF